MSSRNCDWKTASRSTRRIKAELPSQLLQRQPPPLALTSLTERCHQPPRISWRTEQVRGLHQSSQFIGGNQGNIFCATAPYNYNLLIVGNLVQDGSQPLSQTRVCCLHWHDEWASKRYRTAFLYVLSSSELCVSGMFVRAWSALPAPARR